MVGPMPTPAVAMLTHSMRADLGVMISASHNPFVDNGIKLFGPDGYKLSDEDELAIEALLDERAAAGRRAERDRPRAADRGCARALHPRGQARPSPSDLRLDGLKIVVDCANGAAYQVAPSALVGAGRRGGRDRRLAQRPQHQRRLRLDRTRRCCRRRVVDDRRRYRHRARRRRRPADRRRREGRDGRRRPADGADRRRPGHERGELQRRRRGRDGDVQPRARALPRRRRARRWCAPRSATATCSRRCAPSGYNVGGEQSGHIILSDYATTGDGLVAALQVLAELVATGKPASELLHLFDPLPQLLKNVRFAGGAPLETRQRQGGDRRRRGAARRHAAGW